MTEVTAVLDAEYEAIRVERTENGVITVVIDRPDARNALNSTVRTELGDVMPAIEESDARVAVLTGSSDCNAFVAGADVSELHERDMLEQRRASQRPRIYETIAELQTPVIARINGHALGGGLELATACDIRIARRGAKLGQPEINLGIIPGGGGTQRLPRLIGEGQAMKLILTGDLIDVDEAYEIGLVDEICESDALDDCVASITSSIATQSPLALQYAKESVRAASQMDLKNGIDYEAQLFTQLFATEDKNEGIEAFFEDRDPSWQGR